MVRLQDIARKEQAVAVDDPRPCGKTGKKRFAKKADALAALASFGWAKGSRKVHFCVFCDGYHMSKGQRGRPGRAR